MSKTIILGYTSRIFGLSSGLLVLPLVLSSLSKEEFAFWMLFTTASSIVNVLDFGFMSTLSRYYNYVFGGVSSLSGNMFDAKFISKKEDVNYPLLKVIYNASLKIYLILALCSIFLAFIFYYFYLVPLHVKNYVDYSFEWLIYALGITVSVYYLYFNALLAGLDKLEVTYRATIASTFIFLFIVAFFLFDGHELLSLCFAKLISIIYYRVHCYFELRTNIEYINIIQSTAKLNEKLGSLYKGAFQIGLSTVGGFLTNRASVFIVGAYLTIDELGQFSLAALAFSILVSVSLIPMNTLTPQISRNLIVKNKSTLKALLLKMLVLSNFTFVFGALVIVIMGQELLLLIGSNSFFPSSFLLLLFTLTYFFEMNQQLSTNYLTLNNYLLFVKSIIVFGLVYVFLCITALSFFERSIFSAIISQLISQSLFNNWYWPYKALKKYKGVKGG